MNESRYTQRIHRKLPPSVYKWKIKDDFNGGVPDAWYSGDGGHLFIEYKYFKEFPKRPTTKIRAKLSAQQHLWITDRRSEGRPAVVVLGSPIGSVIFEDVCEAIEGISAEEYTDRVLNDEELVAYIVSRVVTGDYTERTD